MPMMGGMPPQMMGGMQGRGGFPGGQQPGRGGMMGGPGRMDEQRGRQATRGPQQGGDGSPGIDISALNQAPPPQQKQMLGEALYPKIATQQPELAGKITGMLLEMDNQELLGLTQDDDALRLKVDEAMNVYHEYVKNQGGPNDEPSGAAGVNGGPENVNPSVEEVKDAEA